jgi:hypothetical protein
MLASLPTCRCIGAARRRDAMAIERRQEVVKRAFNWTPRERFPSASTVRRDLRERRRAQRFPGFLLTRKRSQVQTLSRPPYKPAGQTRYRYLPRPAFGVLSPTLGHGWGMPASGRNSVMHCREEATRLPCGSLSLGATVCFVYSVLVSSPNAANGVWRLRRAAVATRTPRSAAPSGRPPPAARPPECPDRPPRAGGR